MMQSAPVLLLQMGSPPDDIRAREGDLSDWYARALGVGRDVLQVVRVFEGESLPEPGHNPAAIITGSWAMVTDRLDWSEATADWIRRAMALNMPLFGVCYGHQLMAHALGGQVGYHPAGIEAGCQEVELLPGATSDPLLQAVPARFHAHLTHFQTVLSPPAGAKVLARTAHDAHQILRYGPHALSTQFHPEFTTSLSASCVRRGADALRKAGQSPEALLEGLCDTPVAQSLLHSFVLAHAGKAALAHAKP
jgi:GMP synthase (glutamine-hydrolysing)